LGHGSTALLSIAPPSDLCNLDAICIVACTETYTSSSVPRPQLAQAATYCWGAVLLGVCVSNILRGLATSAELRELNWELKRDLQEVTRELNQLKWDLKSDVRDLKYELKSDVRELKYELKSDVRDLKWGLK
jgi:Skp family chaperone for outer membrane proteins